MGNVVETSFEGVVATVRLNRPEHHNAVNVAMVDQLYLELLALTRRDDIHVVVLTGEGRSFCPGADLKGSSGSMPTEFDRRSYHASVLLHEMPQLTVAAINGACAGAGLTWAAACDFRLATRRAKFNVAFVDVHVAGDMGGAWTIPRIVGPAKARELQFITGRFDADEALRIGFVTRVFDDEAYETGVAEVVGALAAKSPTALRMGKANFVSAERMTFADYIELETERHLALFAGSQREATVAALRRRGTEVSGP